MGKESSTTKEKGLIHPEKTEPILKTGDYYFIGQVSKIRIVGENVEVKIRQRPGHIWMGWPITDPKLAKANEIQRGDSVRIDFIQNGLGVLGIHKLYEIKKMDYK